MPTPLEYATPQEQPLRPGFRTLKWTLITISIVALILFGLFRLLAWYIMSHMET